MILKIFSLLLLYSANSFAAESERTRVSGDKYIRKPKEHKIILEGNAKVLKGDSTLYADYVELDTDTDEFTARGSVVFKGTNFEMNGDEMHSNMGSAHGTLKKGSITNKTDKIDGRDIERISRKEFKIKEGRFTSCKNAPPDWRFYGNRINMTIGEYSHMNNVIIEASGLPVAYIPYLVLPVKTERQTGILPPHFSFGADGFGLHESLFVTMGRSQDATATLGHYNNRGFKQGLEYRYAASERSTGSLYFFHINDKMFYTLTSKNGEAKGTYDRRSLKIDNSTALNDNTFLKTKVRYTSDANIPRDFIEEIDGRTDAALESKLMLMSKTQNASYTGAATFYQDTLSTDPLNFNKNQMHKVPELTVNVAKIKYNNFMLEGDASYLHVYRPSTFYDDTNKNNIYDPGEFIRTGHRFDFFPRISMPTTTRYFKFTPQAGLRYDYYLLPADGNAQKGFAQIKTDLSSEFSKTYHREEGTQYRALKHVVEPFVTHIIIPNIWKTDHPFFDTVQNNNGTIVPSPMFDSIDSMGRTNTVTYGVTNRLLAKYISDPMPVRDQDEEDLKEEKDQTKIDNKEALAIESCMKETPDDLCSANDEFLEWIKTREEEQAAKAKDKTLVTNNPMLPNDKELNTTKRPAYMEDNKEAEISTVIQPVLWKVYQSYNFEDTIGRPYSYVYSDLTGSYNWVSAIISNFYNIYSGKMGVNSFVTLTSTKGSYLRVGYSFNKTEPTVSVSQARFGFGFRLWRMRTNARFILNNEVNGTLSQKIQDRYFDVAYYPPSSCWYLQVAAATPYDKPGFHFTFTFNLIISGASVGFMPGQTGSFLGKM